jgi:hypothetical protein
MKNFRFISMVRPFGGEVHRTGEAVLGVDGDPSGSAALFRDISMRKQAQIDVEDSMLNWKTGRFVRCS